MYHKDVFGGALIFILGAFFGCAALAIGADATGLSGAEAVSAWGFAGVSAVASLVIMIRGLVEIFL